MLEEGEAAPVAVAVEQGRHQGRARPVGRRRHPGELLEGGREVEGGDDRGPRSGLHTRSGHQQRHPYVGDERGALAEPEAVLADVEAVVGGQHHIGVGPDLLAQPGDHPVDRLRHLGAAAERGRGGGRTDRPGRRPPLLRGRPVEPARCVVRLVVAVPGQVVRGQVRTRDRAAVAGVTRAGAVGERRREAGVARIVRLGAEPRVGAVGRDREEERRRVVAVVTHEVDGPVGDHGPDVRGVLLLLTGPRRWRRDVVDLDTAAVGVQDVEVPPVVAAAEDRLPLRPARRDRGRPTGHRARTG